MIRFLTRIALIALAASFAFPSRAAMDLERPLTPQDIREIRDYVRDESVPHAKRLELAKAAAMLLEFQNRSNEARQFAADFAMRSAGVPPPESVEPEPSAMEPVYVEVAKSLDEGRRGRALDTLRALLKSADGKRPPSLVSLLGLKTGDMLSAYHGLFADLGDRQLGAHGCYTLGVLLIRDRRFNSGGEYLDRARGKLGTPRLERWLTIDRAKLAILTERLDEAGGILEPLLRANPNDPAALYWSAFAELAAGRKESARRLLSRLVPHLYPDPRFLAEAAALALRLDELGTAASILESRESEVEPHPDYYETFYLVRKAQNRPAEATEYLQKAARAETPPFEAAAEWIPERAVDRFLTDLRERRRREIDQLSAPDILSKVYLLLLEYDHEQARKELSSVKPNNELYAYARWMMALLDLRAGREAEAYEVLLDLRGDHPEFRPYEVLALLSDCAARLGKANEAAARASELAEAFPGSLHAQWARAGGGAGGGSLEPDRIHASPMIARHGTYAPAFVLNEIIRHWGDPSSFSLIAAELNISPRGGIAFNQLLSAFLRGTRYQVVPFIGTVETVSEYLRLDVPVVYCEGGFFASQEIDLLCLLTGYDVERRLFRAAGATASAPALLPEGRVLQGICLAVYPMDKIMDLSETAAASASFGEEFLALNTAAALILRGEDFDPKNFEARRKTLAKENARGFIPHQLAMARYIFRREGAAGAEAFINGAEANCAGTPLFWYIKAGIAQSRNQLRAALDSIERAVELDPGELRFQLAHSRLLEKTGNLGGAIARAEELRLLYPEEPSVYAHLIAYYEKAGDAAKRNREEARLKDLLNVSEVKIEMEEGP